MPNQKREVQYRYYEMPPGSHVLALLGAGWVRAYGSDLDALHFHNHLEIGYCYDGTGHMEYDQDALPFCGGTFTVIPPNTMHNTKATPGTKSRWEYLFIDVKGLLEAQYHDRPELARQGMRRIYGGPLLLQHAQHPQPAALVLALMEEQRHKRELHTEASQGLLQALLCGIARLQPKPLEHGEPNLSHVFILQPAIDYATTHYREHIRIAELAEACHLSETHFRRVFGQYMRMPPLAFVNLVRIEQACRLLRLTNGSVQDVAVQCGFATLTSFNRNFKEVMGISPTHWRKDTAYYENKLDRQNVIQYEGWK